MVGKGQSKGDGPRRGRSGGESSGRGNSGKGSGGRGAGSRAGGASGKGRGAGQKGTGSSRGRRDGRTIEDRSQQRDHGGHRGAAAGSGFGERRGGSGRGQAARIRIPGLPGFVQEDLARVTAPARIEEALAALATSAQAFTKNQYPRALGAAQRAKQLAPRDPSARELLGLAAYRLEDWKTALAELRAFRRLTGEPTHLPVEIDVLRALGRGRDVEQAWQELRRRRPKPPVMKEGRVVYASYLLDQGRARQAWTVIDPGRIETAPYPEDLRVWFVAARVAVALGNLPTAIRLRRAIVAEESGFPGIGLLDEEIARA